MRRALTGVLVIAALVGTAVAADVPLVEDTPAAACAVLKEHMAKLFMPNGKPGPAWFCDHSDVDNQYFYFMALRKPRGAPGEIYSTLIGWFAVARRSKVVLEWDVGEDRLVPISPEYSRKEPGKKK